MAKKKRNKEHEGKTFITVVGDGFGDCDEIIGVGTFNDMLKCMQSDVEEHDGEHEYRMYEIAREVDVDVSTLPRVIADGYSTKS